MARVKTELDDVARAIMRTLETPNESDRNLEPANVVDGLFAISRALWGIAEAIEKLEPEGDEQP